MNGIGRNATVALVGSTGFVGSNILGGAGAAITGRYHSTNIAEAYGTRPDLLIYAGLRAEKYLANRDPERDRDSVARAEEQICRIEPGNIVLISTIDVFQNPKGADERTRPDTDGLCAYGLNRYRLENWTRARFPNALIIRLPALFGQNMKKNFLYDFLHPVPAMLAEGVMRELCGRDAALRDAYDEGENGFYRLKPLSGGEERALEARFRALDFTALRFTDSRSRYQFYPLARLWDDIQTALRLGIPLWHPATEPVSAAEVYRELTGGDFVNELGAAPADYDYRTLYAEAFGGKDGYIADKARVLREIRAFVTEQRRAGGED